MRQAGSSDTSRPTTLEKLAVNRTLCFPHEFTSNLADFNECNLNNAGCEHICNNTGGSFNCECRKGFKLKADKRGCEGKNRVNTCLTTLEEVSG